MMAHKRRTSSIYEWPRKKGQVNHGDHADGIEMNSEGTDDR